MQSRGRETWTIFREFITAMRSQCEMARTHTRSKPHASAALRGVKPTPLYTGLVATRTRIVREEEQNRVAVFHNQQASLPRGGHTVQQPGTCIARFQEVKGPRLRFFFFHRFNQESQIRARGVPQAPSYLCAFANCVCRV